ncbi:hypothetical protein ANCDUO_07702 [Ancylostoma duodenale]|uniref:Major facilitator superfamily (MFS) profile domain-containing protein n=1 Tax=Ancylostoma duodenale TaxID=51022 RepID=A0A0C2DHS0_9BILA|nr:hypothetical protein ANCDUO_07702 [Ancylostoma duodenale]
MFVAKGMVTTSMQTAFEILEAALTILMTTRLQEITLCLFQVDTFGKLSMVIPFSTLSFISAILTVIFLPETVNKPMPETISDVEGKKIRSLKM